MEQSRIAEGWLHPGDIYLFYRHGSHQSDWVYQKSTDNGRTFAAEVSVLKSKRSSGFTYDAWYAMFTKGLGDTIAGTYVYHPCASLGHSSLRVNAYYMQMDCSDGSWRNAAGKVVNVPVTKEEADIKTLVYNSNRRRCDIGMCRVDQKGFPHVTFHFNDKQIWYTRWGSDRWQAPVGVTDGSSRKQDGDMIIKSPNDIEMLIAGLYKSGGGELCWWKNTGGSWKKGDCVASSTTKDYNISSLTRDYHPDGKYVIYERNSTQKENLYRKVFLLGENGFIERPLNLCVSD